MFKFDAQDALLKAHGPDGGFRTGYDQAGTYANTLENAETTSIVMITFSSLTLLPVAPAWILIIGTAILVAGVAAVIIALFLERRKTRNLRR